jgi:hypothetical protein
MEQERASVEAHEGVPEQPAEGVAAGELGGRGR